MLPEGFQVALDPRTLRLNAGRVLVGGSPVTVLRLAPAAAAHLVRGVVTVTEPISARLAARLMDTNMGNPMAGKGNASPDGLTVVIPVRDRPAHLDRCLTALAPLRVVVVDDASTDPASVAVVADRHGAVLVQLTRNVGPAGARNAGMKRVETPLVAFVDSDVEVDAAHLLELTHHFADPELALVAPKILGQARSDTPRWFERYDEWASSLTLGNTRCTVRPGAAVAWLPGACLVGRISLLGAGFDAAFRVGEDVDLVWRLSDAGHRVRYEPGVVAYHDARGTVREWLGRKFVYGTGSAALAERHGSRTAPAVLSPVMAASAGAVLARGRLSPVVVALGLAFATRSIQRSLAPGVDARARTRVALLMSARGLGWAVRQESSLLVRAWWPLALLALPFPLVRRALVTAVIVDSLVAAIKHAEGRPPLGIVLAGRRLDDLAYGGGLWWGALQRRSFASLRPRRPGRAHDRRSDLTPEH